MSHSGSALCLPLLLSAAAFAGEFDDWSHYGGSEKGMQYSSLAQISTGNVGQLEEAWRFQTNEPGGGKFGPFAFQANPILIEGRLFVSTGSAIVIALDPASGKELWRYDPDIDRSKGHSEIANRGVSSWIDNNAGPDDPCRHRIFVGTLDARLIAVDGSNGKPCRDFGEHGQVFLDRDVKADNSEWFEYTVTSPPVIVDGVVIVGSAIGDNRAVQSELGIVRGIDAKSGAEIWRWDPIPRSAENPAFAGWQADEAKITGSANAWAPLAADSDLGLVYVPTGSASPDFFGGERQGDNLYANSLVALSAASGAVVWYRQLVHHDLWDYDLASQPTLVELQHNGETVPAVLQGTKTGMIFSFDRRNGDAIFAVEERPVPQGGVDGEHLSPTQPFPVAPPPLVSHAPLTPEDAWGMMWFDKRSCAKRIARLRSEGIYTPPSVEGTILYPGYAGGINWGGVAFDPEMQLAIAYTINVAMEVALIARDELQSTFESDDFDDFEFARQRGTPYGMRRKALLSMLDIPCTAPPWGTLSAVDMVRGSILWQVPVGTIQDIAPAIVPNLKLGVPGIGGPITTAGGLIFLGATMDDYLRAFDIRSGDMLWEGRLPAGGQATPMTYFLDQTGKQYVVIAAGGHPKMGTTIGDYVVAFALPDR
ncbi:MAG: pyrroloquinoline quinone-dependent dehydrogenase [Gammaproteobacteria bacterium]|nr:pyrroloquinoline quinone-dependent dehydrogenase [Gammaproteobacteria bacterium]MDH5213661.1 pyrroloquinoline quinone-dependent dehydrogenase [Gammaproteobacteria bacterium]MDH5500575.1 pyrroloquinoline quinone-dependent dehydrogenase [Gammaproteobacteria bacterium]